jgi:hypothetical protein
LKRFPPGEIRSVICCTCWRRGREGGRTLSFILTSEQKKKKKEAKGERKDHDAMEKPPNETILFLQSASVTTDACDRKGRRHLVPRENCNLWKPVIYNSLVLGKSNLH